MARGKPELFHVGLALHVPGRFPRTLHRRDQQPYQQANHGQHHQQFDQRHTRSCRVSHGDISFKVVTLTVFSSKVV
jgi:hypothetical protein